jgi:hypothetical protein
MCAPHRGLEGRPLNVSPIRKGWVGIPIVIRERHRRGTHFFLNQSAAFGNRGCQRDDGILYQGPTKEVAEKGRTGSETRPLQRIWFFRSL